jgi:hypothetical protein
MNNSDQPGDRLPASISAGLRKQLTEQFRVWAARFRGAVTSPAIDYGFRPSRYWTPAHASQILSNIKGANRKRAALGLLAAGRLDQADNTLLTDTLSEDERTALGRIHPTLMGGEYLPDCDAEEVEIARITMASTTQDVISIRARPVEDGIAYRVVDEYDTDYTLGFSHSAKPLTLAELVHFIETADGEAGAIGVGFLDFKVREQGEEVEDQIGFLEFSSEYYEQLSDHYELAIRAWAAGLAERQP